MIKMGLFLLSMHAYLLEYKSKHRRWQITPPSPDPLKNRNSKERTYKEVAKNTLEVLTLYYTLQNLYKKSNNILKENF